jgi:hypothetical protein
MEPELHLITFMVLFNLFITFVSRYYSQTDLLSSFSIGDTLALISSAGDRRCHVSCYLCLVLQVIEGLLKNRKYSEAGIAAQTESSNLITLIVIFL